MFPDWIYHVEYRRIHPGAVKMCCVVLGLVVYTKFMYAS